MSANLLVDLGNTAVMLPSLFQPPLSGAYCVASGKVIGGVVDLLNANTYTNVLLTGASTSGRMRVEIQTADDTNSGSFTDPTSGFTDFPGVVRSGGLIYVNSGGTPGGVLGAASSGQYLASGFTAATAFLRPGRYARLNTLNEAVNGSYCGPFVGSFVGNMKTTGSGGGQTQSPGSGTVSV